MQKKIIGALLLTAGLPLSALAVSLGDVELFSALNQPLNAEIEIKSISRGDAENLIARLASEKDFVQNSIPRPYWLNGLQFTPFTKKNGRSYIRVTSKKAIREPFVNFLVDMEWPKGRLVREYTLLLDPPAFLTDKPVAAPAAAPATAELNKNSGVGQIERDLPIPDIDLSMDEGLLAPAAATKQTAKTGAAKPASKTKAKPTTSQSKHQPAPANNTYLVERGDTMSSIAGLFVNEGVSLNQVLMAIVKNNKRAFINGNVNLVKAGATLTIPATSKMTAVTRKQASNWLQQQNIEWRQGASAVASAASTSNVATTEPTAKPTDVPVEMIPDMPAVDNSQLSIVSPDMGNKTASEHIGSTENKVSKSEQLQHNLTMASEQVAAADLRQQEVESRILELENIAAQSKAVLDLKSQKLSQLQANASASEPAAAAEPPKTEPVTKPKPKPAPVPAPAVNPNRPSGIMGTIYDLIPAPLRDIVEPYFGASSLYAILVILLVIILLPVLLLLKRRQKDEPLRPIKHENWQTGDLDDSEVAAPKAGLMDKIKGKFAKKPKAAAVTSDDLLAGMNFGDDSEEAAPLVETVDVDNLADDAMSLSLDDDDDVAEASSPDENDEVVTEADVYIAYGLNDKAEELLQAAIQKKPHKAIYYVKLMETYKEVDDKAKFIAAAENLKTMLAGNPSSSWDRALQLGHEYAAENPLFGGAGEVAPVAKVEPAASDDFIDDFGSIELEAISADSVDSSTIKGVDDFFEDAAELDDISAGDTDAIELKTDHSLLNNEQIENILTGAFDDSFFEDVAPQASHAPTIEQVSEEITAADFTQENKADFNVDDADSLADVLSIDNDLSMGDMDDITSADLDLDIGAYNSDSNENAFDLSDLEDSSATKLESVNTGMVDADGFDGTIADEGDAELTQLIDNESLETMIDDIDTNAATFALDDNAPDSLDEVGTKLDLASAYIDMADLEGAKASLLEVLQEGSNEQKQEAQRLLEHIETLS